MIRLKLWDRGRRRLLIESDDQEPNFRAAPEVWPIFERERARRRRFSSLVDSLIRGQTEKGEGEKS